MKGGVLSRRHGYFYKNSPEFRKIPVPHAEGVGDVGYRSLSNNNYIQFYTRSPSGTEEGGKTLVISAHGGYFRSDTTRPPVMLPPDRTIQFLTPHATALEDPGLENIVNVNGHFEGYLSIYNNQYNVRFRPQYHNQWHFSHYYDPHDTFNTLGRRDGLQNYRHSHFAEEHPAFIAQVVANNRKLAAVDRATPTDVLIVNNKISYLTDTSLAKASVQRVLDLDRSGELVNAAGERYNTFVFAHCRSNLLLPESRISLYRAYFPSPAQLPEGALRSKVLLTIFCRQNAQSPFTRRQETVGEIAFVPVSNRPTLSNS